MFTRVCHTCVSYVQENLENQTQHAKTLGEKLWLAERQLEELEVVKDTKDKRTSELNSSLLRLETEVQANSENCLIFKVLCLHVGLSVLCVEQK